MSRARAAAGASTSTVTAGDCLLQQLLLAQLPQQRRRGRVGHQHVPESSVELDALLAINGQITQVGKYSLIFASATFCGTI